MDDEIADLVVVSVNNHADLLEALVRLETRCTTLAGLLPAGLIPVATLEQARAAIAAAAMRERGGMSATPEA